MKRAVVVLLLLIANALVSANRSKSSEPIPVEPRVQRDAGAQDLARGREQGGPPDMLPLASSCVETIALNSSVSRPELLLLEAMLASRADSQLDGTTTRP